MVLIQISKSTIWYSTRPLEAPGPGAHLVSAPASGVQVLQQFLYPS